MKSLTRYRAGASTPIVPPAVVGEYNLPTAAYVSAGIYRASDPAPKTLLRTLWANEYQQAGLQYVWWDGLDDEGNNIIATNDYEAVILTHNLNIEWSTVGNTSTQMTGNTTFRSYSRFYHLAITGDNVFIGEDFNEGRNRLAFKVNQASDIQSNIDIGAQSGNATNLTTVYNCTNGTNVYWGGYDPYYTYSSNPTGQNWCFATKVSDDSVVSLSSGSSIQAGLGQTYSNAFAIVTGSTTNLITGMACNGNYVWVARGSTGNIYCYDATTGALLSTSPGFTNPRELCYDASNGGRVWFINGVNQIVKGTIGALGALTSGALGIPDFPSDKLTLAIDNRATAELAIVVGGTTQQVWFWNISGGTPSGTVTRKLGQLHGYQTGAGASAAVAANDKFCFSDNQTGVDAIKSYIVYDQSNSSIWVGDPGCNRTQIFDSSLSYLDTIQFIPTGYQVGADTNDATKAYINGMEFTVDINGGWTFSRNFAPQFPDKFNGSTFKWVSTVSGVTLATIGDNSTLYLPTPTPVITYVWQLTDGGPVNTGYSPDPSTYFFGYFDNSFNQVRTTGSSGVGNSPVVKGKILATNAPTYNPEVTIFTMDALTAGDAMINGINGYFNGITTSNIGVVANPSLTDTCDYHLQGYNASTGALVWSQFRPTTNTANPPFLGYSGWFPGPMYYDIGNGVIYSTNPARVVEKITSILYHGEGWKSSQTNFINLYWDNGLPVTQMGIDGPSSIAAGPAGPRYGGNAISDSFVKYDTDNYFFFHGDEAAHSALHFWRIKNVSSIATQTVAITGIATEPLVGVSLMGSVPFNSVVTTTGNITADAEISGFTNQSGNSSYDHYYPDITLRLQSSVNITKKDDLEIIPAFDPGLTSHTVFGQISFPAYYSYQTVDAPTGLIQVLDVGGRVISQLGLGAYNYDYILRGGSGVILTTTDQNVITNTLQKWQNFSIVTTATHSVYTYGDYTPVTASIVDGVAIWNEPKWVRILVRDNDSLHVGLKTVAVKELRYAETV